MKKLQRDYSERLRALNRHRYIVDARDDALDIFELHDLPFFVLVTAIQGSNHIGKYIARRDAVAQGESRDNATQNKVKAGFKQSGFDADLSQRADEGDDEEKDKDDVANQFGRRDIE